MSRHRRIQLNYVVADLLASVVVWLCFLFFRWLVLDGRIFGIDEVLIPAFNFWRALVLFPLGSLIIYYLTAAYLRPFEMYGWRLFGITLLSATIITLGSFFVIIIDDVVDSYQNYLFSLLVLFLLEFGICYAFRLLVSFASGKRSRRKNVVVVGSRKVYERLSRESSGMNILCYLPQADIDKLSSLKSSFGLDAAIIAVQSKNSEAELYELIKHTYRVGLDIYMPVRTYDIITGAARISNLQGSPLVCLSDMSMSDIGICVKRMFDIVASALGLIVLSPMLALLALIVRRDGGPALYSQERIGLNAVPFNIYKFRTMRVEAENGVPQLTQENDERLTSAGAWLRKYRLDELPQLWNVLRGDMSIVGPRPERQYYIEQIEKQAPFYCLIYKVRPGLTSWGPIKVGYTDTIDKMIDRLNYDITYVNNMSIVLDIKIICLTFGVIIDGKGQ